MLANILVNMTASNLTPRQAQVVKLLEAGLSPRDVSKALDISTSAVYAIKRRIEDGEKAPPWARGGRIASRAARKRTRGAA